MYGRKEITCGLQRCTCALAAVLLLLALARTALAKSLADPSSATPAAAAAGTTTTTTTTTAASWPQANQEEQRKEQTGNSIADLDVALPEGLTVASAPTSKSTHQQGQVDKLLLMHEPSGKLLRVNNVEKLKKGLANFVNQLNPAPFFVPATQSAQVDHHNQQQQQEKRHQHQHQEESGSATGKSPSEQQKEQNNGQLSSGDLATLVNSDSTVDVLIKGPIRAAQTRPIGGPLRWGRRR